MTKTKKGKLVVRINDSGVGVLLLDASHKAIYSNAEAVLALAYPERPRCPSALDGLLGEKMHLLLPETEGSPQPTPCREFVSGRRRYLCRVIPISSCKEGVPDATVVVLERRAQQSILFAQARSS